MLVIISAIFLSLSITGMLVLVYRHRVELQSLNPKNLSEVRDLQRKKTILERRLKRKLLNIVRYLWPKMRPVLVLIRNSVRRAYYFLLKKEKILREVSENFKFQQKTKQEQDIEIDQKLEQAETEESSDENLENKYLEILSLDPKRIDAYEGLAGLYLKQKDFEHAREIYEFIIKTAGEKVDYFIDLSFCWRGENEYKKTFKILERALKIEPKNPKIIDLLCETAIMMQDSVMAKNYLVQLKEVNPDNQKIAEFKSQIAKL